MERFSGGGVEMRFFYGFRGVCSAVWRWREERMMSTAVLREIEREESVCAVDVGVCLCVVWFDRCPMMKVGDL